MVYALGMDANRNTYSVQELADLAGITVRTLHHDDQVGLLVPARRMENGYRFYNREDVLRLQ